MRKKVFPIPSDIRWCLYLGQDKVPTGEMGHICKGFETGHAVMGLFTIDVEENVIIWTTEKCTHCHEPIPEDTKETLRFIRL